MREVLERHQQICDDLYQLALDENQFLQTQKRPIAGEYISRKQALLDELTGNLDAFRESLADAGPRAKELAPLRDRVLQRIQQIIHLDRENEKLLLKYSLPSRTPATPATPVAPNPAMAGGIARLYGKVVPPRR